ncbi:helix-turn-helix domain-containing protein [Streptomyces sp. SID8382]|uniref:helix-turn-helix transcriptional regulator n=1 Tax=Streptomyces malaysiensis TaxID=92644 RepID=UPI000CA276A5|nr:MULTISPECIES: helix-turn-helix transcriptional regulator [unclassified Streptomyces]AUA08016.1 Transcriptional activator NphR [Streptomyces sp. M56]MYX60724.1 helix-turn-helix domain-containing protein [Streptomyces sp. SID8382]
MQVLLDASRCAPTDRAAAMSDYLMAASGIPHRVRVLADQPTSAQARVSGVELDRDVFFAEAIGAGFGIERTKADLRGAGPERIYLQLFDGDRPGHYEHDDVSRPLRRGDLCVTDLNAAFAYHASAAYRTVCVQVDRSRLEMNLETIRRADHRLARSPLYGVVRDHLASLSANALLLTDPGDRESATEATVALLKGLVASAARDDDAASRNAVHDHLLDRIRHFLRMHAGDQGLGPDDIAAAHAISVRKLFQLWQSQPLSLSESIMQLRLEAAQQRLITRPDLTIAAVARASGFVDASHFSRRFRLALGCTPTAWRAEHHDHSPGMNADAPRRAE